jgi:aflatoxin B1 aldehyde reductase
MKVVLGTLNFSSLEPTTAAALIGTYASQGVSMKCIDTAAYYKNESFIAKYVDESWHIQTKADPWPDHDFSRAKEGGGLSPDNLKHQLKVSVASLPAIQTYLFHAWDSQWTSSKDLLKSSVRVIDEAYRTEKIRDHFGLSNMSPWQVDAIFEACEDLTVKPTVYQGMYNAACRTIETELIPCIREYGMSFQAYNPLAGGLLAGKNATTGARASWGLYQKMFYANPTLQPLSECMTAQQALHWLRFHSMLNEEDDAIVIGASTTAQLYDTMHSLLRHQSSNLSPHVQALIESSRTCPPDYFC